MTGLSLLFLLEKISKNKTEEQVSYYRDTNGKKVTTWHNEIIRSHKNKKKIMARSPLLKSHLQHDLREPQHIE